MKTFLSALCVWGLLLTFVIWNTVDLQSTLRELIQLTETLPQTASAFSQNDTTERTVHQLYSLWDKKCSRIAFTSGYPNCNRADEAMTALFIHYQNNNAEDFTYARLLLYDSLLRLKMLEGLHLDSIF